MNGVELQFGRELALIQDSLVRRFTIEVLARVPDYFWTIPASSSGKYHPPDHLGDGGLVRHVKKAVELSHKITETFELLPYKDLVVSAILLHDGMKYGLSGKDYDAYKTHGELMKQFMLSLLQTNQLPGASEYNADADFQKKAARICDMVETHMGIWGNKKPSSRLQMCVHLADLMSAHKMIVFPMEWYSAKNS